MVETTLVVAALAATEQQQVFLSLLARLLPLQLVLEELVAQARWEITVPTLFFRLLHQRAAVVAVTETARRVTPAVQAVAVLIPVAAVMRVVLVHLDRVMPVVKAEQRIYRVEEAAVRVLLERQVTEPATAALAFNPLLQELPPITQGAAVALNERLVRVRVAWAVAVRGLLALQAAPKRLLALQTQEVEVEVVLDRAHPLPTAQTAAQAW